MLICHSAAAQGRCEYQVESTILVFFLVSKSLANGSTKIWKDKLSIWEVRGCIYSCPDKRITVVRFFEEKKNKIPALMDVTNLCKYERTCCGKHAGWETAYVSEQRFTVLVTRTISWLISDLRRIRNLSLSSPHQFCKNLKFLLVLRLVAVTFLLLRMISLGEQFQNQAW